MTREEDEKRARSRRRTVVLIVVLILILLWLLRSCRPAQPARFDYFRAKAEELGSDPARIVAWVKDKVPTLVYRSDVKGPLATLWNGAGSPEEKKALADALLATRPGGRTVSLDEVAPERNKEGEAASAPLKLTLTHRVLLAEGEPRATVVVAAPIGAFVGDVHTIDFPAEGKTRLQLRGRAATTKEIDTQGAVGEEVELALERPGGGEPLRVVRELWDSRNRVGATFTSKGDRHDFVVLPCRTTKYVREKEELILKEAGRKDAPEAKPYLTLLDYARESDGVLAKLEAEKAVRAQFDMPRILVLSRWPSPSLPGNVAQALDLRWNRTSFEGPRAYEATEVRSFVEAGLEQQFLERLSGVPCTSTFDVMTRLKDDYPNSEPRRLALVKDALAELGDHGGLDGSVRFSVRDPLARKREKPIEVVATRDPAGGFHLKGGPVLPAFAQALAKNPDAPKIPYTPSGLDATLASVEEAATAVESTLLAADAKPAVGAAYVLDVKLDRGTEPLVTKGAVFDFAWGAGETRTDQRIKVLASDSGLDLHWRVQTSSLPAAGSKKVSAEALATASVHNPWYRVGSSTQKDATSFCLSRRVFAALKAGKSSDLALQARLGPDDDEKADRKLEWKGSIVPVGAGSVTVPVNGKPATLATLRCKAGDLEVALLDDLAFPVGMADKLVSIATTVRARLVDEQGVGIAGATVAIAGAKLPPIRTAVDGSFRLPPSPSGSWGKVKLQVTHQEEPSPETEVDLTAPGLAEVTIQVARLRPELAWITDASGGPLDELPLSDQVKRNAKRDLALGRMVVIPKRMVADGDRKLIAYWSCERDTGYLVGVTEDGLNGSDAWSRAVDSALDSVKSAIKADQLDPAHGSSAVIHMYRGALVAFWTYCNCRLEGMSGKEAIIATLEQMDTWATNLDITHFASMALGDLASNAAGAKAADKLAGKLSDLVGQGVVKTDDDASKAAFKLGYMGATLFLANHTGDADDE
jgi:hypothetical protein